ncbi:MAG: desulfoferrodoxin [Candidatus Buchananbacteria bacterium RBG_13_39_9]|uniref:Desulfoferrodoxin n=1 Tax=Candidatus Buchananbacteria bacterium RBG_13_39_9 TaxID=1797531 RepID=A0A1G1XQS3_9BACT|nr:MAG: desulfoferrodoxin [Candidatus Buchananbacteria bacterium RBG_13_39_9]
MVETNQIYKCSVCGNIIEVVNVGGGQLVCCGQNMELLEPKSKDAEGKEKHVPVIEKTKTGFKIKVGSVPHPMLAEHYIQWIEILADGVSYKTFLQPGMAPEAEFCVKAEKITARIYCNIHGLWQNES